MRAGWVWKSIMVSPGGVLALGSVAERFRAPGPSGRKRPRQAPKGDAALEVRPPQELVEKSGVEAVPGADRVHGLDGSRAGPIFFPAAPRDSALGSGFDH